MIGYQPDGRRKTKSFYGKTRKEAGAKEYFSKKEKGINVDASYSFCDWADIRFDGHKNNIQELLRLYGEVMRIHK